MSNQNRFLLPHTGATSATSGVVSTSGTSKQDSNQQSNSDQENKHLSVDTDFDSYWEEEARNPHRNRIRIGRQYQATVPPLLKAGEKDQRKLDELETLSFCPKRSAKVSNAELDHYFTVAKSLNLFASLVETRSLLGRDVTIADLNHIRHKEGLSLASVIQPPRQFSNSNVSPQSSQQASNLLSSTTSTVAGSQQSPPSSCDNKLASSSTSSSPREALASQENFTYNQPLMKALSHFISLHHPCRHDSECKKLLKELPLEDEPASVVSITAGNLRQCTSSSSKSRFRSSSYKQNSSPTKTDEVDGSVNRDSEQSQGISEGLQSPSYENWTREEVELFSKAIEVCGKNLGSIKKEFFPSKSVRSIVEYYYIGYRDASEAKRKPSQSIEATDGCTIPEKPPTNNNGHGGRGGPSSSGNSKSGSNQTGSNNPPSSSSNRNNNTNADSSSKTLSDSGENVKKSCSNQDENTMVGKNNISNCKQPKLEESINANNPPTKNIDARMSVYNFDDDFKDELPVKFDCPRPGAEVRPLKAKPILPSASLEAGEAGNSNVGSLKFFMDGQLVLKLNACQEQQEEKCHWVQSSDKVMPPNNRQKRYTKRAGDRASMDPSHNGSHSNSIVSSNHDEDSKTEDLTADEDSKESAISFTNVSTPPRQKSFSSSPTPKRLKTKNDVSTPPPPSLPPQAQLASPIDYNRLAVNNRMKERNDNPNPSPIVNQASPMPWLQANSFAMAAALLGGLQFPASAAGLIPNQIQNNQPPPPPPISQQQQQQHQPMLNLAPSSKPMDLSLEHSSPKPIQTKPSNRSRSRPKNS